MDRIVFVLCTLTSVLCAILLYRGYRQTRSRLLIWSAACFSLLGLANFLLYADRFLILDVSLLQLRSEVTLAAVVVLLVGLIWEAA
ncbi:MAG: DUF5985 family protein [Bdellovibrionota bacterium]